MFAQSIIPRISHSRMVQLHITTFKKIKEANIKLLLDTNQTDYRNEGHSYKWHCNSYEVVFYDKIKDLEKAKHSEKRAIEKDSALQLNLFRSDLQREKSLKSCAWKCA